MARPASSPGRSLQVRGDAHRRRMAVHDRTRLTGRLLFSLRHFHPLFAERRLIRDLNRFQSSTFQATDSGRFLLHGLLLFCTINVAVSYCHA